MMNILKHDKRNINLKPSLNPMSKRTFPLTNVKQTCQFNTHEHDQDYHMNDERSLSWRSPNNETYLNRFLGFHHSNTKRGFLEDTREKVAEPKHATQGVRNKVVKGLWRDETLGVDGSKQKWEKRENGTFLNLSQKALFALSFIETNRGETWREERGQWSPTGRTENNSERTDKVRECKARVRTPDEKSLRNQEKW